MYRQSSGIFMGSSPAPDFANYFAFMHEFRFYQEMITEFQLARADGRTPLYPFDFIEQFGVCTKRYTLIDDIFTVALASQTGGISLADVVLSGSTVCHGAETLGGMYDPFIPGPGNTPVPTSISLTRDQSGPAVNFLDMHIAQNASGSYVTVFDKRDTLPSLQHYRRFPHFETLRSLRCKYAVFHSQMCRFAARCTRTTAFERATAKLLSDMLRHHYRVRPLRSKLYNFSSFFFVRSPIHVPRSASKSVRLSFWTRVQQRIWFRVATHDFT